jgi:hypothetical protein
MALVEAGPILRYSLAQGMAFAVAAVFLCVGSNTVGIESRGRGFKVRTADGRAFSAPTDHQKSS